VGGDEGELNNDNCDDSKDGDNGKHSNASDMAIRSYDGNDGDYCNSTDNYTDEGDEGTSGINVYDGNDGEFGNGSNNHNKDEDSGMDDTSRPGSNTDTDAYSVDLLNSD
jgi:hypothetical protein